MAAWPKINAPDNISSHPSEDPIEDTYINTMTTKEEGKEGKEKGIDLQQPKKKKATKKRVQETLTRNEYRIRLAPADGQTKNDIGNFAPHEEVKINKANYNHRKQKDEVGDANKGRGIKKHCFTFMKGEAKE